MLRLRICEDLLRPSRRTPSSVRPSTSSNSTEEPTTSNSRGSTLTFTPSDLTSRIVLRISSESELRGAMITRSMSCSTSTRPSVVDGAEHRLAAGLAPVPGQWDSPHHGRLERGGALELLLDPVGAAWVADHQAALGRGQGAYQDARPGAARDHRHEEEHPDPEDLVLAEQPAERTVDQEILAQPDEQRVQGRHLEEGGRLVQRGLAQQVLVTVVEPDRLRDHHHEG